MLAIIGAKAPAPGEEAVRGEPTAEWPLSRSEIASLLTLDTDSPASIVSCVSRARERGRTLRDVISTEMWEALNSFNLSLARQDLRAALATGPYSVYQEIKDHCALFWGLLERTMLRDEARSFLEAGGRIEEADMVLRMLRVGVPALEVGEPGAQPRGRGARAAACGRWISGIPPSGTRGAVATKRRSVPPLRKRVSGLGRIIGRGAARRALETADASPRSSPPVLRAGRLIADLELQRRAPDANGSFGELLAQVQDELELVEHDIDQRYFPIAALAAVHL